MQQMTTAPLYFQFTEQRSAFQALGTLQELGYETEMAGRSDSGQTTTLRMFVENEDLTSALEIAQAHGGLLVEGAGTSDETAVYTSAYGLEGVSIPAHVVTEDLPESYLQAGTPGLTPQAGQDWEIASNEDYDHFPAGIRL